MSVGDDFDVTFAGDGDSPESAQDSAAQNSLEYLQIMTNK